VDTWIERLRRGGLRTIHVRSHQTGIAAATNRGFERVRTHLVATTHDDCLVAPDWLELLSQRVRRSDDAIVTGRVQPEGPGVVLTVVTSAEPRRYTQPMTDRDVLFPANMALPVRLLERIGYMDEHPSLRLAAEDNEWAYRALRARVSIVYDPEVVVSHLAWQGRAMLRELYRRYARGQGAFYGKYVRRGDPHVILRAARDLARAPWLLLRGVLTRNEDLVAMGAGEVTGLPVGLIAGLRNAGDRIVRAPRPR
jgi:GT2 family glycosyltransferase